MNLFRRKLLSGAAALVTLPNLARAAASLPPTTLASLGQADLPRTLDYSNAHQVAIETAGALPASLGAILSLELQAHRGVFDATGAPIKVNGIAVKTWTDTRVGGFSGTQGGTNLPVWIKNAYGPLPALRFTGTQVLSVPDDVSLRPDSGAFRVFMVARTGVTKLGILMAKGNNASGSQGYEIFQDYTPPTATLTVRAANSAGATKASQTNTTFDNNVRMIELALDGSTITGFLNGSATSWVNGGEGATVNTYTAPISNTDPLLIGANATPTYGFVDIFALLVFKGSMTTDQVGLARRYLQAMYPPVPPPAAVYGTEITLWTAGVDYPQTRIPAIVRCNDGTLIAFMEGASVINDSGQHVIAIRRSTDNGATWATSTVVRSDGTNCCGNAAPIVNRVTGTVHLLSSWNLGTDGQGTIVAGTSTDTRRVYWQKSTDSGLTWTTALEITSSVKLAAWRWYATGPGANEQLASGRLLIPCNHSDTALTGAQPYNSHVIYSDDDGTTWHLGATLNLLGSNEDSLCQRPDGTVIISLRNELSFGRYFAQSTDNGITFTTPTAVPGLPVPICQSDILAAPGGLLVYIGPTSLNGTRVAVTIYVSTDGGVTWPATTLIRSGSSAYSDAALLADGKTLAILYEQGTNVVFGTGTIAYPKWTT